MRPRIGLSNRRHTCQAHVDSCQVSTFLSARGYLLLVAHEVSVTTCWPMASWTNVAHAAHAAHAAHGTHFGTHEESDCW